MNTLKLYLEAQALSDWSIRAGYGLTKQIDSAVIRDSAGLPYLPAKTLVGVVRERATQIAISLDEEIGESRWLPWITYIFGSQPSSQQSTSSDGSSRELPRPAHLEATALRMTTATRASEVARELGISIAELRKATTVTRVSTKINSQTGTTLDGSLRVEERARAGTRLRGQWSLNLDENTTTQEAWPALFLLASALKTTSHVGGRRRRGSGEFTFSLQLSSCDSSLVEGGHPDTVSVLSWLFEELNLDKASLSRPPSAPQSVALQEEITPSSNTLSVPTGEIRKIGTLLLTTVSPLIASPTKKGTVVTSSSFISGATILGLAQRALKVPAEDIQNGSFLVTHAYPAVGSERKLRSIPWPLALTRRKGSPTGEISNKFAWHEFDPKLKPSANSFVAPTDRNDKLVETVVPKVARTHASIKSKENPELFEYRAIEAGVKFAAEIWWDRNPAEVDFPAYARLGTSHKDDYGLTRIQFIPTEPQAAELESQEPGRVSIEDHSEFTLVLTSDVLLSGSDCNPEPTAEALLRELEDTLDLEQKSLVIAEPSASDNLDCAGKVRQTLIANVARHETWQVSWGLPRPTLIGLAAGSVVRIHSTQKIEAETLSRLNRGIGNRTAEGYGRVLVNPAILKPRTLVAALDTGPIHLGYSPAEANEIDNITRAVILQAVLLDRVSQISLLSEKTASRYLPLGGEITNTQLNQLRELSQMIGVPASTIEVNNWGDENCLSSAQKDHLVELFNLPVDNPSDHPALRELDIVENGENQIYETPSSDIFAAYLDAESESSKDSNKSQDLLKSITKSVILFLVKTAQKSANERK